MRRYFLGPLIWVLLSFAQACATEPTAKEPMCPPDPRAEDIPELLFTSESFDSEAFAADLEALRTHLPKWIEERHRRLADTYSSDENRQVLGGELLMSYLNTLSGIEGYVLKLEYLA